VGKRGNHLVATVTTSRNILVFLFSFACFGKQELEAKIEFELSNSSKKFRIFCLRFVWTWTTNCCIFRVHPLVSSVSNGRKKNKQEALANDETNKLHRFHEIPP
jgi:hypothetical protein